MKTPKKPRRVQTTKSVTGRKMKYEDGGPGPVTRKDISQAKKQAKLARIQAGTEPSAYQKAATITGNVANAMGSAAQVASAVRDTRAGAAGMQKGGRVISQKAAERKTAKGKGFIEKPIPNYNNSKGVYTPFTREGRKQGKETGMISSREMKPSKKIMKKGGTIKRTTRKK